jgi:Kef-type K+ transport system membrane component KefB
MILGELLAGVIFGPPLLGIITPSPAIEMLGELGIFFVMFYTGMELDPKELLEHKWPSITVAFGGFILPFILGYFTAYTFGGTQYQSLFVGMGVSITAIAVQAVILHSMRINQGEIGHIIIGAAIVDDILALIALSTLLGLAKTGSIQVFGVLIILLKALASFFGWIFPFHPIARFLMRLVAMAKIRSFICFVRINRRSAVGNEALSVSCG